MKALPILCFAASLVLAGPTLAQDGGPDSIGQAIGQVFEGVNLRATPPQPADFVVQSRPAEVDYVPLAPAGARQTSNKKSPKELRKIEDEFGAAAAANRARAARVKIPDAQSGTTKQRPSAQARGSAASPNPRSRSEPLGLAVKTP